jgi:hypothetical protein
VTFHLERFLRRANGWSATPPLGSGYVVQRFVGDRGRAHAEFEYEITRPVVVGPA